jgi:hypothetical protein
VAPLTEDLAYDVAGPANDGRYERVDDEVKVQF